MDMTEIRRTRTPSAGMESALLSSAADLLETEGPAGLSVRRIAAAATAAPLGICPGTFESLVSAVERAIHAGVIAEGSPTETAQLIWATIHGWVSLELLGLGFVEDRDAGYERLCKALLRGLRP